MMILDVNPASDTLNRDASEVAWKIVAKDASSGDAFWQQLAQNVITGLILHIVTGYPPEQRTMITLYKLLDGGPKTVADCQSNSENSSARRWLKMFVLSAANGTEQEHVIRAAIASACAAVHLFILPDGFVPQKKLGGGHEAPKTRRGYEGN